MRWIFFVGAWVFLAGILVQALLAGRGIFGASTFAAHVDLGWALAHMVGPLLLIVSLLTRMGWQLHILAVSPFVLAAIVPILASFQADQPEVAALHPLSALVTFGLLLYVAIRLYPLVVGHRTRAATGTAAARAA